MQELVKRLSLLDPGTTETLQVITYFDALVAARAGRSSLLRAAAGLAGCTVGCALPGGEMLRVAESGRRLPIVPSDVSETRPVSGGGRVWLERPGTARPSDPMLLERLALALELTVVPEPPADRDVVLAIDATGSPVERSASIDRLTRRMRLRTSDLVRALALPAGEGPAVDTPWGRVGVAVQRADEPWADRTGTGVGVAVPVEDLTESWASALVALRARRDEQPVLCADDLGSVLTVALAIDAGAPPPRDVAAVSEACADPVAAATLSAVADASSVRGASMLLGVHHSTLRARLDHLQDALGFDPRTPHGHTRLDVALTLARIGSRVAI